MDQYNKCIQHFREFCLHQGLEFPPQSGNDIAIIAEFLNDYAIRSERPESMLRTISSALKHWYKARDQNLNWNSIDTFVRALIKCETTRPAGRTRILLVQTILATIEKWGPNENMKLTKLRQKAISLLALAAMCRPSDLAPRSGPGLLRNHISFKPNGSLQITFFAVKNDTDRHGMEVQVDATDNPLTDPVGCMRAYLEKTPGIPPHGPVFVNITPPHSALTATSISGVLRETLKEAGLSEEFSPRCFRPTGATAATVSGVEPHTARSLGRWKSEGVFFERYVYPQAADSITEKISSARI